MAFGVGMKLAPILSVSLALVVAACGTDLWTDSKGDAYDSAVKQTAVGAPGEPRLAPESLGPNDQISLN
jgi:hypothetical protein